MQEGKAQWDTCFKDLLENKLILGYRTTGTSMEGVVTYIWKGVNLGP